MIGKFDKHDFKEHCKEIADILKNEGEYEYMMENINFLALDIYHSISYRNIINDEEYDFSSEDMENMPRLIEAISACLLYKVKEKIYKNK